MTYVQSTESYENLMLCKEVSTTVFDYYINVKELAYKNTLLCYNDVIIYEAEWRMERVCVKEVNTDENISNELLILSKCIHPKIVQFLGFHRGNIKTTILFEYMENGNLHDYMKTSKLTSIHKIQIMLDVSKALHYLHNRYPEIILHRDMKPSNILINKHGDAKIADFGISKMVKQNDEFNCNKHSGEKGTYVWMSPEVLKGEQYNHMADIYSLGLIMYYIWTGRIPFSELKMTTIQLMFQKNNGMLVLLDIEDCDQLNTLIHHCVMYDPASRPNTKHIIEQLTEIFDNHNKN